MEADTAARPPRVNAAAADVDPILSSDSLEDSDTDSASEERRYQSDLQTRIHRTHGVIFPGPEEPHVTGGAAEDQGERVAPRVRPPEIRSSYSELRYDPNWRKHQNRLHKLDPDEEDAVDVSSMDSEQWPPDEMTLDTSEDRESPDGHPYWKPLTNVTPKNKKIKATPKPKPKENGQIGKQGAHQESSDKRKVPTQGEVSKKDIVEKNKVTLGVRKEKSRSYVHIHKKKMEEGPSGQHNEKSDLWPPEDESHLRREAKLSESMEDSGLSRILRKTPKDIHMAGSLQWDRRAVYSGDYDHEYMTFSSHPERYRDSLSFGGPYSLEELLQMRNEGLYHRMRQGRHVMETVEGAEDLMEMYMYPSLSQVGALTFPEPGITFTTHNDALPPGQIPPQTQGPTSSSETDAGARDRGGNERTRSSGRRQKDGKDQKRLKSFLNQEVKLGGLGPTHTVSEEKKEQLKQQKEYAKEILERNRGQPAKPRGIQVTHSDKSTRQKSLDYAKNVPRPQPVPRVSNEKTASATGQRAMSCESLLPRTRLLEDLQLRHEKEKMAVAALNALHIL
ncbi:jhy protein homolog [Phyllobates terribilis]|uniref:jhy protein homolog n=1 Tax=Phyllobates terribilis TaxID=111132 RepID=UPI003CCA87C3